MQYITYTQKHRGKNTPTCSFTCMGRGMHVGTLKEYSRVCVRLWYKHELCNSSSFCPQQHFEQIGLSPSLKPHPVIQWSNMSLIHCLIIHTQ